MSCAELQTEKQGDFFVDFSCFRAAFEEGGTSDCDFISTRTRVWGTKGRLEIANGSEEDGGPDCLIASPAPSGGGKEVRAILPLDVFLIYQAKT
jgi:hypothetical protein